MKLAAYLLVGLGILITTTAPAQSTLPAPILMPQKLAPTFSGGELRALHWRAGSGTHRVVLLRELTPVSAPLTLPKDGTFYRPSLSGGTFAVSAGLYANGLYYEPAWDTTAAVSHLPAGRTYEAAVFDYYVDPVHGPRYQQQTLARLTFTVPVPAFSLRVSPNPAAPASRIHMEGRELGEASELVVVDMAGRLRHRQRLLPLASSFQLPPTLLPGVYLLRVRAPSQQAAARLVIAE